MKQIRNSVFETNSSSSHSICVSTKKGLGWDNKLPVDQDGTLHIPFGEFGWGPEILSTPVEKISYYCTDHVGHLRNYCYGDDKKPWEDLIYEFKNKPEIQELIKIIKENCPDVKDVMFISSDSYDPFGYVDHDSSGTSYGVKDLRDYIFNNSVYVIIDNDNSNYYDDHDPEEDL